MFNTYDIDGVINLGEYDGIYPGKDDIIITGRSYEEAEETYAMMKRKGIDNFIFFNPIKFDEKTRLTSGRFKGIIIKNLIENEMQHGVHFEDDEIQIQEIKKIVPGVRIVHVVSDLVEKENVRHK
jgi:hypothetical protein